MYIPLKKRDWGYGTWSGSGGARWAFFAIFIILIILIVVGTIRVNKKRSQRGAQPIYGTRWMTPPSYVQSQHQQYHDPQVNNQTYVPTYTATANEYDMGYYDNNGNFHANPNAKSEYANNPTFPDSAHHREPQPPAQQAGPISPSIPVVSDEHTDLYNESTIDDIYRRPSGPPNTTGTFTRPEGPPPFEGSSGTLGTSLSESKTPPKKQ